MATGVKKVSSGNKELKGKDRHASGRAHTLLVDVQSVGEASAETSHWLQGCIRLDTGSG
jgi:hypothetical protein